MSYAVDRYEFIQIMVAEGLTQWQAERLLSYSTTLDRLATAQCNGTYPFDNGQCKVKACIKCEIECAPQSLTKDNICPKCIAQNNVKKLLESCSSTFKAIFSGNTRGYVLKIKVPSGRTNDWGCTGICVPSSFRG